MATPFDPSLAFACACKYLQKPCVVCCTTASFIRLKPKPMRPLKPAVPTLQPSMFTWHSLALHCLNCSSRTKHQPLPHAILQQIQVLCINCLLRLIMCA